MRILMVLFNQVYQGTYWRAYGLARELAARGHKVTMLITSKKNRVRIVKRIEEGIELVETPDLFSGSLRSGWDGWNIIRRIMWLRGRQFDIIHAFESRPTVIFPALFVKRKNIPMVMDWADWFGKGGSVEERSNPVIRFVLRPVETFFENHFRPYAQGTTVICSALYQKALALGVPADTILYLKNGADLINREPTPIAVARAALALPLNIPIIGYVGSIFPKDGQFMVEAFENVLKHYPETRLLVAGYCPFNIRSAASRPENVIQTGFLDNQKLNLYLSASDLFWLPLRNSNANRGRFPYKLTDYLAIGRPVVATAVGDLPNIFNNQSIGLLSEDSPESLAAQTVHLLENPEQMKEFGLNARRLAETRFSWREITQELEAFYFRLRSVQ